MITKDERKAFILALKEHGPLYILDADEKYRGDFIIMITLVRINAAFIGLASEKLRKTQVLLDLAAKRPNDYLSKINGKPCDFAIQFLDVKYLLQHPEITLEFLEKNMENAGFLQDRILISNKKVYKYVLDNLERNPLLWHRIKDEDKMKKNIVMKVINQMPNMIGKLPLELQCDVDVVTMAAKNHDEEMNAVTAMYSHMDKQAQKNPEVCKALVKADPRVFPYLKFMDEEIAEIALAYDGEFIQWVPKKVLNKDLVKTALQQNGMALQYVKEEIYDDKELVLMAVKNCGWAIKCASSRLQADPEIIEASLRSAPELVKYGVKINSGNKR